MIYRRARLVASKQEEEALAFTSHGCTQGVYLPDVTVVLRTQTEVIACSITSPTENTRGFIESELNTQMFTARFGLCIISLFGAGGSCRIYICYAV